MILSPDLTTILETAESPAERFVAQLLHDVDGGPDAVGFHSVKLRWHRRKQQAEADFVVLWNGVVIVLEVKGGGVRKADGRWWTVNRRNDWRPLKESPMDQANDAKHALREILHQEGIGWYSDQHAVITPDVEDVERAIGWYPSQWLAAKDMTAEGLSRNLDEIASMAPSPPHGIRRASVAKLREKLYGEFAALPRIDAVRGAILEEQNRVTSGQARYLEGLVRSPRIIVLGGAGTGKSLALAEGAKQEADQGRSVLVTFKSPGLTNFFETLVADRPIEVVPFGELSEWRRASDVVFVDEAQDLMTAEDMDRLDAVIVGGRAQGRWRLFLDRNNQAHVDGAFDEDVFQLVAADAVEYQLPLNVRNTMHIVHVVQEYLGADVGDPGIVHGETLHWHTVEGPPDVAAAEIVADKLVADGVRPRAIWIIDASSAAEPLITKRGVTLTGPKYAKGLEAERVIVCNLPEVFDHAGCAAFYVAVTRARVGLHLVVSRHDTKRLQALVKRSMEGRWS